VNRDVRSFRELSELNVCPRDRVLVFAPHPDDESLAVGGLLQRAAAAGAFIRTVFWTDGEDNPWAQRLVERRVWLHADDRLRWGERRRSEVTAALHRLGLGASHAWFWQVPDQRLEEILLESAAPWIARVIGAISSVMPTLLVVPSLRDLHPDHSALAVLTRLALDQVQAVPEPRLLEYLIHGGGSDTPTGAVHLSLSDTEIAGKRAAIRCHASQLPLRSAMMLGFVQRVETFRSPVPVLSRDSHHPIEQAAVDSKGLRLERRLGRRPALGPSVLRFVWNDAEGVSSASLLIPPRVAAVDVRDARRRAIGSAVVRRAGRVETIEVLAPFVAAGAVRRLFVKLERPAERKLGFFDRAGWREAAIAGRAGATGGVPARALPAVDEVESDAPLSAHPHGQ